MASTEINNLEKVLKALANRKRIAILKYLKSKKEISVGDIASEINLSMKSTSKHLSRLSVLDILERKQKSKQMFYRLSKEKNKIVEQILSIL